MCVLGVCEFEYVSVHESGHVTVKCTCDCQYVYVCICVPNVIINKFAIVVIHYGPLKKKFKKKKKKKKKNSAPPPSPNKQNKIRIQNRKEHT